jgi:Arc/MetJ family transcription regulator
MRLDQALLDSAKRALGTTSETEAVTLALRRVVDNARVAAGLRALGGSGIVDPASVEDPPAAG